VLTQTDAGRTFDYARVCLRYCDEMITKTLFDMGAIECFASVALGENKTMRGLTEFTREIGPLYVGKQGLAFIVVGELKLSGLIPGRNDLRHDFHEELDVHRHEARQSNGWSGLVESIEVCHFDRSLASSGCETSKVLMRFDGCAFFFQRADRAKTHASFDKYVIVMLSRGLQNAKIVQSPARGFKSLSNLNFFSVDSLLKNAIAVHFTRMRKS